MRAQLRGGRPPLLLHHHEPVHLLLFLLLLSLLNVSNAAFINFENCLPDQTINSEPRQLQFTPYFVDATFLQEQESHNLTVTIYGNVSGRQFTDPLPAADDPHWSNPNETNGKIANVGTANRFATLTADYTVLTYTVYDNTGQEWCPTLINGTECPLGPTWDANASDPFSLPAFSLSHDFATSYAFSTISTTVHIISGDEGGASISCVSVQVTPDLGSSIAGLLTWLPATILILKGLATLAAAIWSPWGSSDIFRWSSNYGRDEDLLRLVTPGFGDCLQYIQFIVLTGSLTLQYPGFFRPAVSQAAWSTLMFNQSFVSEANGYQSLRDGLYTTNATYGLGRMGQLVGMANGRDIWACMAIWLLVIAAIVIVLCQLGFLGRWLYHLATNTTEEDLRRKNLPFTLGNLNRLLFNFFILPIVALSLYQLVIAPRTPIAIIVCTVILLVIMVVSAAWVLRVIFSTKPRTLLFDDMPTVLLYGPLYNTYSDSAAPFALVPVFITFMRGVAIGALQPSGIAQIIVLAVCEVILILTLNGFRPFQGQTSMNLYHTFFASVRLTTILLSIAFAPSLGVTEAPKGWIGYAILLLHACVLVFGFFLNSAQTLIEVLARSLGAGGKDHRDAVRGSILNWRMLKKRQDRPVDRTDRGSMMSSARILETEPSAAYGTRSRSISASSQQLLNRMSGFENFSQGGDAPLSPGADLEHTTTLTGSVGANGRTSLSTAKADDAGFYRPPRQRKATMETLGGPATTRAKSSADFPYQDSPGIPGHARDASYDSAAFGSPAPAYLRERSGSNEEQPRTDYAVREVDQYYRGPALNDQPGRKLKTGPADPTGPAATAQSWFNKMLFGVKGNKTKDQGKGFEVVRSSRMPPGMQKEAALEDGVEMQNSPAMNEPYKDTPDTLGSPPAHAVAGAERSTKTSMEQSMQTSLERSVSPADGVAQQPAANNLGFGFDDGNAEVRDSRITQVRPDSDALGMPVLEPITYEHADALGVAATPPRRLSEESQASRGSLRDSSHYAQTPLQTPGISQQPIPFLAPIDPVDAFSIPSRWNSNASSFQRGDVQAPAAADRPPLPRVPSRAPRINVDIGDTGGGQDWLHDVDQLSWPDHSRQSSMRSSEHQFGVAQQVSQQSYRVPPPSVPRRSSRRTPSQDVDAQRATSRGESGNVFEGFDSNGSTPDETERPRQHSNATPHSVSHKRAADSISRNSIGAAAALREGQGSIEYGTPPTGGDFLNVDEPKR